MAMSKPFAGRWRLFLFKIVVKKVKVELLKNPWACDSRRSVRAHHSSLFPAKQRQEVPESCAA